VIYPNPHPSNNYRSGCPGTHLALDLKHRTQRLFAVFAIVLLLCVLSWAYTVVLTWGTTSCPQTPATLTYNVYRGLISGGPYIQITSGLSSPTYTDTGVVYGGTYYYVVTGVCTCTGTQCPNGGGGYYTGSSESQYSNEFGAFIASNGVRTTGTIKIHGEVKIR
jgi:hypothetical protein